MQLLKRAYARFNSPENGQRNPEAPPAQPEPPQAQPWECAQAPSSCTLKWGINGVEILLMLRAATDQELFTRIGKVLPRIEEKLEAQPQDNGGGTSKPTVAADTEEEPYCHFHNVALRRFEKTGQSWYSHKAEDGTWCRGK